MERPSLPIDTPPAIKAENVDEIDSPPLPLDDTSLDTPQASTSSEKKSIPKPAPRYIPKKKVSSSSSDSQSEHDDEGDLQSGGSSSLKTKPIPLPCIEDTNVFIENYHEDDSKGKEPEQARRSPSKAPSPSPSKEPSFSDPDSRSSSSSQEDDDDDTEWKRRTFKLEAPGYSRKVNPNTGKTYRRMFLDNEISSEEFQTARVKAMKYDTDNYNVKDTYKLIKTGISYMSGVAYATLPSTFGIACFVAAAIFSPVWAPFFLIAPLTFPLFRLYTPIKTYFQDFFEWQVAKPVRKYRRKVTKEAVSTAIGETTEKLFGRNIVDDPLSPSFWAALSGISIVSVAAIVLGTREFMKKNKKKILEGATPASLAPKYVSYITTTLMLAGVGGVILLKTAATYNAIQTLSNAWSTITMSSTKKRWAKAKKVQESVLLQDLYPDILSGVVWADEDIKLAVAASSYNFNKSLMVNDSLRAELLARVEDKFTVAYPGLTFTNSIPNWKTEHGQHVVNRILTSKATIDPRNDFATQLAIAWCGSLVHRRKASGVDSWHRTVYYNGQQYDLKVNNHFIYIVASHIRYLLHFPTIPKMDVYNVHESGQSVVRIAAPNMEDASRIFDETLTTRFDSIASVAAAAKTYLMNNGLKLAGVGMAVVITFVVLFYYHQGKWYKKISPNAELEHNRNRTTKGGNIAVATNDRLMEEWDRLRKQRGSLEDQAALAREKWLDAMSHGNQALATSFRDDYDRVTSSLNKIKTEIDAMYNDDHVGALSGGSKKTNKRANNDRSLPNNAKSRKNNNNTVDETVAKFCKIVDCNTEIGPDHTMCQTHYLAYRKQRDEDRKAKVIAPPRASTKPKYQLKTVPSVSEARIDTSSNPQRHTRQTPSDKKNALAPIYHIVNGVYQPVGVAFAVVDNSVRYLYTATHNLVNSKGYLFKGNFNGIAKYVEFTFETIEGEWSRSPLVNFNMPGASFKLARYGDVIPTELTFYTLDVNTFTNQMMVNTRGHVEDRLYHHSSDTFSGQCGSPYVGDGLVYALHIQTDYHTNAGTMVPSLF